MTETEHIEEKDGFGLDKDSRLEAKQATEEAETRPKPLDPPFPFRVIAFDTVVATRSGN